MQCIVYIILELDEERLVITLGIFSYEFVDLNCGPRTGKVRLHDRLTFDRVDGLDKTSHRRGIVSVKRQLLLDRRLTLDGKPYRPIDYQPIAIDRIVVEANKPR